MERRGAAHNGGHDGRTAAASAGGGLRRARRAPRAPLPRHRGAGTCARDQ